MHVWGDMNAHGMSAQPTPRPPYTHTSVRHQLHVRPTGKNSIPALHSVLNLIAMVRHIHHRDQRERGGSGGVGGVGGVGLGVLVVLLLLLLLLGVLCL